ncbi:hypothetical protein PANDA_004737 [Ailuropoda melanoleuca]|uniref:Uncharacterized protein n=1 Tax=Ailuropoda melanoleuca TaxID=9646 RepID=D2H4K9_AILME|nr:hypothetical protein PANDA_004737 [Ailuropoda melanoleuca]
MLVGLVMMPEVLKSRELDMGYCILFAHGLRKLCTCLNRWGATTLTVCTALLLLLFSWKTVKQNETWLSRESLFPCSSFAQMSTPAFFTIFHRGMSGVQTLPHNAKVHYNYANFLKDQGRNREAIYHYRTALRSDVCMVSHAHAFCCGKSLDTYEDSSKPWDFYEGVKKKKKKKKHLMKGLKRPSR